MHTQQITKFEYDVTVKYGEFADASYENKLNVLTGALSAGTISPKMFMKKLYGNDTLSKSEYDEELQFLEAERNVQQMMHIGGAPGQDVDDEDEIDEGTLPAEGTENEEENNASEMLGALLGAKK
jgi:phospholipase C